MMCEVVLWESRRTEHSDILSHFRWTEGSNLLLKACNQPSTFSLCPAWFPFCNSRPLGQAAGSSPRLFGRSHTCVVCKHVPV